ncbi:MAG: HAD family hydrolase [Phycisphaerales bacterium]
MLILFDIDGTLYKGNGSGRAAFLRAGAAVFGEPFTDEGVAFSGRLDPLIFADLIAANRRDHCNEKLAEARALSHAFLKEHHATREFNHSACPGTIELVERLRSRNDLTLGVLTGNWPENGRIKLESVGFDPDWFPVSVWGMDGPTRNDLPPVACSRYLEMRGEPVAVERVLVVGDTIHDIACAKVNGCRSLAVATGGGSWEELEAAAPDRLVPDLSETDDLIEWIDRMATRGRGACAQASARF